MIRNVFIKILSILLLLFIAGCFSHVARYDRSFHGRVVDAETGEPIEGVVVLGTWHQSWSDFVRFYDAKETLTDKKGNFSISGKGIRVISDLEPVDISIFKAGYKYTGGTRYSYKKAENYKAGEYYEEKIKWEGNRVIIPLRKLTMKERKRQGSAPAPPHDAPLKKVIMMLREIDKDRKERGLDTRGIWRGEKYE